MTEIKSDTRKLESFEAFLSVTSGARVGESQQPRPSLRSFVEQRRQFLLKHADLAKLPRN